MDSDEEVDYSKMDQVTDDSIPSGYANLKLPFLMLLQRLFVATGGAVVHSCMSAVCFRGTKKVLWVAGTLTLRRSIQIT